MTPHPSGKSSPEQVREMEKFLNHLESEFARFSHWKQGEAEKLHHELLHHQHTAHDIGGKFFAEYRDMTDKFSYWLPEMEKASPGKIEDLRSYVTFLRSDLHQL